MSIKLFGNHFLFGTSITKYKETEKKKKEKKKEKRRQPRLHNAAVLGTLMSLIRASITQLLVLSPLPIYLACEDQYAMHRYIPLEIEQAP